MKRPLAITLGDPAGIGPEVTFKALYPAIPTVLIGPLQLMAHPAIQEWSSTYSIRYITQSDQLLEEWPPNTVAWYDPAPDIEIEFGTDNSAANGRIAYSAIHCATQWALNGIVRGIVTAPISKRSIKLAEAPALDHTGILAHLTDSDCTMGFFSDRFNVVLTTIHCPLSEVPRLITPDRLTRTIRRANEWLLSLGVPAPRIAVAGLNPHAGEDGLMGSEELTTIGPVITHLKSEIPGLSGPYPADTLFGRAHQFDCIIAQYHDQGLAPLKLVAFDSAVNTTLGLPFVRTSPDHGTAIDIAYSNCANPRSMIAAIALADRMAHGD